MDEFSTIRNLANILPRVGKSVLFGIGDDAAVLKPTRYPRLLTVDSLVEETHFDLRYTRPEDLGAKLIAINLSDIAAMGGVSEVALLSISLPRKLFHSGFLQKVYRGMRPLLKRSSTSVVGGNLTFSRGPTRLDCTLLGHLPGRAMLRSNAKVGDVVAVTGVLGSSAGGQAVLQKWGRKFPPQWRRLVMAHLQPSPPLNAGPMLAAKAQSCIDISDGLSSELNHLARESRVGMRIDPRSIPLDPKLVLLASALGVSVWDWVLHGGEDYQLLFTLGERQFTGLQKRLRAAGVAIARIGEVTPAHEGVRLDLPNGKTQRLPPGGWNHFKSRTAVESFSL